MFNFYTHTKNNKYVHNTIHRYPNAASESDNKWFHAFFLCKSIAITSVNYSQQHSASRYRYALDHRLVTIVRSGTISRPLATGWKNDEITVDRLSVSRHDEDERLRTRDVAHPET